jgi:hypothetical protein
MTGQIQSAQVGTNGGGGPCWIAADKGTYKVSIRFKSSSGKVLVKERALKVLAYT